MRRRKEKRQVTTEFAWGNESSEIQMWRREKLQQQNFLPLSLSQLLPFLIVFPKLLKREMASTSEEKKVDTGSEVDKSGAKASAREEGGGDAGPTVTQGAGRIVDKAVQTDAVRVVDKAVQTDPFVDESERYVLKCRLLAMLYWMVGMGVVFWTQQDWISQEMLTGDKQDSLFVVSLLLFFSIGTVVFVQELFEVLQLFPAFRKFVEGRDLWRQILFFKETFFIPVWALGASRLWRLMWRNLVCKSSSDEICRWNAVGKYMAAYMNASCVVDKQRMSIRTCGRIVSFAPLAVFSFAAFFFSLAFSDAVERIRKKRSPPKDPEVTEGQEEEGRKATRGFQVPWEMLALSLLQAISYVFCIGTNLSDILMFDPHRRHELWRFLTASLVHDSSSYLWGNIRFQLMATVLLQVDRSCSTRSIAGIYVVGNLGCYLASSLLNPQKFGIGASGGCFALFSALIVKCILIDSRRLPPIPKLRATHFLSLVGPQLFFFFVMSPILLGLFFYFRLQHVFSPSESTGHEGHFGGAVAGILGELFVSLKDTPLEVKKKNYVKRFAGLLVVGVVAVNVCLSGNYGKTEWNFDYLIPTPVSCVEQ